MRYQVLCVDYCLVLTDRVVSVCGVVVVMMTNDSPVSTDPDSHHHRHQLTPAQLSQYKIILL